MNDLNDFYAANETIERDPVKRLNAGTERSCERILPADLPADVRNAILGSRLGALHARAKEAIERGQAHLIDGILAEFASDLGRALDFEREHSLKVVMPADEIRRASGAGLFEKFAWHRETGMIVRLLDVGDRIGIVNFREIEVRGPDGATRTITRRDPRFDQYRPISRSKESFYAEWCTPTSTWEEAEAAAKREIEIAQRPFSATSGPNAGEATVVRR